MFGIVDKIFRGGYIENMGWGRIRKVFQSEIDNGRASPVNRETVNRLTDAMLRDDLLLGNCIKEAEKLGHRIL